MGRREFLKNIGLNNHIVLKMKRHLQENIKKTGRGAPLRINLHIIQAVLFRLKTGIAMRIIGNIFNIPYVSLWRWCNRFISIFSNRFDQMQFSQASYLIVDTTSTRVRTTNPSFYTAYKKTRVVKSQILCNADGVIHSVSKPYPGAVHDKVIWDECYPASQHNKIILADKVYAGATGDGIILFRPVKKNEHAWRDDRSSREWNRFLSRKRVKIEHVFAQLKTWRIIHHYFPMNYTWYDKTLKTIAWIHNQKLKKYDL